jgi:hypothetical protein
MRMHWDARAILTRRFRIKNETGHPVWAHFTPHHHIHGISSSSRHDTGPGLSHHREISAFLPAGSRTLSVLLHGSDMTLRLTSPDMPAGTPPKFVVARRGRKLVLAPGDLEPWRPRNNGGVPPPPP